MPNDDNILKIGATVDLGEVQSGMGQAASLVDSAGDRMVSQFRSIQNASKDASKSLLVDWTGRPFETAARGAEQLTDKLEDLKHKSDGLWEKLFEGLEHPFKEGGWKEFADGVEGVISHPFKAAGEAAKDLLIDLGPIGAISVGAAAGLFELGKKAFELVDEEGLAARQTQNMANMLGLTFEQTKKLSEMARIVDADIGGLARASFRLAEALNDPSGAGKAQAEALQKLGITATDSGDALIKVLEKLAAIPDATTRIEQAHILLGRASFQLQPLIANYDKLSEAVEALGGKLSAEGVDKLLAAREATNEWGIAWDHLKEKIAAAIAPLATFGAKLLTPAGSAELALDQQIKNAQISVELLTTNQKIGAATLAQVEAGKQHLAALEKEKAALADSAAAEKAQTDARVAAAKAWQESNGRTLDGMKKGLEDLHAKSKELEAALSNAIKPLDDKERVTKNAEYVTTLQKEAALKLQIKAAEKAASGEGTREQNELAQKRIEEEKKIHLVRISLAEESAKQQYKLGLSFIEDETAALLAAEAQRYEIEKAAAEKIRALKEATAAAEHKPAGQVSDTVPELALDSQKRIAEIKARELEEQKKATEENAKLMAEIVEHQAKTYEKAVTDATKALTKLQEEGIKTTEKVDAAEEAGQIAHANRVYDYSKEKINEEFQQFEINLKKKIDLLKELERARYATDMAAAEGGLAEAKTVGDPAEIAKAQAKIQQIADEYSITLQKMDAEAKKASLSGAQIAKQYMTDVSGAFEHGFGQWLEGHKRFSAAMAESFRGMADQFILQLIRMQIQRLMFDAINHASSEKQKLDDAKVAATSAFKSVYQAMPFPINVVLAPVAAAAAFAGAMTFEEGGIVPRTQMALVHGGERVLTQTQTSRFEHVLEHGNTGAGGGENHFHFARGESPHNVTALLSEAKRAIADGRSVA